MVKAAYTFLGCLLISASSYAAPTTLECQTSNGLEKNLGEIAEVTSAVNTCSPALTDDQITGICNSIYNKKPGTTGSPFAYKYEEDLWELSCVKPGQDILGNPDSLKEAHKKIQAMWNSNRKGLRCKGFPQTDDNITNFSMNAGFPLFLRAAVKVYKLDMNFKDENQLTVMDYIQSQIESYKRANMVSKVAEFEKIYKVLADGGAKHGKELKDL